MSSPQARRRLRRGLVAAAVLLLGLGGAALFVLLHEPGNVSHPNVEFTRPATTAPGRPSPVSDFEWPRYGFDAARTRLFVATTLEPPLRVGWTYHDGALLEFPPVIYQNTLYFVDDNGYAHAVSKLDGHALWQQEVGRLAAASPALGVRQGLLFIPVLSTHSKTPGNGRFVALSLKTGRLVWSVDIPAGTESSPIAYGDTVYFGDQAGNVYSLRASDGQVNWRYHATGAVKGGPALSGGILYFGDYAGRAYAVIAATGRQVWAVATSGAQFGFGSGNFYSTPAVAFGRVYMGNTDGRVYSFAQRNGELAWATGTGAYVYASPAVADTPGLGPTVYLGSYDRTFYAFDARSGAIRWSHRAGGRISGSATIVGDVVYFSDLGSRTTTGLDTRTGRVVFSFRDGAFNPVIADYGAIYLIGYKTIYQMLPIKPARPAAGASSASGKARKH